ncbi:MAG: mucoidy inhibitor MuiA family protein [Bosea sp.]|uniref:mucoidy inhibitor MuiA family protein n=1 Tax=Bosea sp. (in: a-proteobacteria) TaxID=1871050 RepID=UPI001AC36828|nr:mucoidy inhibitor MuiA family protein [Bosea sp. (in: a-proteobacteria)]MBN9468281.1 mucoidy inhibitor MuiA family protein [Bosea sp. (in: a-proteobacteria)]
MMMKTGLAAALFLAPGLAGAAEIELASQIDRVTVYPDGAVVTRLGKATLLQGVSQIVLRGLPATVDPTSIRVEAEGDGPFTIGAVDVRQIPGEARPAVDAALEGKIRALQGEKAKLSGEVSAVEAKRATIENFGRTGPDKLGPDGKALPVTDWPAIFDAIGTALVKVQGELLTLRNRISDLDAEIAALEKARPHGARAGQSRREVAIAVEAKAPVAAEIAVSYRVSGASWLPVYEARLTTGNANGGAEIVFTRRAELRQRTGEDWSEVAVELSTTRSAQGTRAPELSPLRIAFYEPPVVYEERARALRQEAERAGRPPALAVAPASPEPAADALQKQQAEIQTASISAGAYQASFMVPGRVSIPPDGSSKAVVLTQGKLKPELAARATPELEEKAYLEASFSHEDEAPLLAGEVYLHRDGAYIGKGRLRQVAPGDKVELGFGADDRIKVTRAPVRRRENDSGWLGSTRTDQREFKTVVKSLHAQPVKLTVIERVPFSENSAITVELLSQSTPPTEKQVGDKRGVSAWSFELAPGAQKEIRLAYRIKYPGDREVVFDQTRR